MVASSRSGLGDTFRRRMGQQLDKETSAKYELLTHFDEQQVSFRRTFWT